MKGTSSAESDNLSACITREIGSYLEEDNISLLIKDMDEKKCVALSLTSILFISLQERGEDNGNMLFQSIDMKFSVRGKETEPVLLDSIYAFKCLKFPFFPRLFSEFFKLYLCHVNGARITSNVVMVMQYARCFN